MSALHIYKPGIAENNWSVQWRQSEEPKWQWNGKVKKNTKWDYLNHYKVKWHPLIENLTEMITYFSTVTISWAVEVQQNQSPQTEEGTAVMKAVKGEILTTN